MDLLRIKAISNLPKSTKRINHVKNVGIRDKTNNNRIENRHSTIRDWERTKRGMKSRAAEHFEALQVYHNYIRPHLSLGNEPPDRSVTDQRWISTMNNKL